MKPRPGLLAVTAVVVAAGLVLGGCSGAGEGAAPVSTSPADRLLQQVAAATEGVAQVRGRLVREAPRTPEPFMVDGTFTTAGTGDGASAEFAFTAPEGGGRGVITPTALYVAGTGVSLPSGKQYAILRLDRPEGAELISHWVMQQEAKAAGDLPLNLELWRSMDDLRVEGAETVEGVQATRLAGVLDGTIGGTYDVSTLPADTSPRLRAAYQDLLNRGVERTEVTVWIGPDGRPVRLTTVSGTSEKTTTTVTYTGWYPGSSVAVPEPSTVAEFTSSL